MVETPVRVGERASERASQPASQGASGQAGPFSPHAPPDDATYLLLVDLYVSISTVARTLGRDAVPWVHGWSICKTICGALAMLLVHVVLASLAAIAAIAVVIKHAFLLPLDEALHDTQQVCFESPNSITPVVVRPCVSQGLPVSGCWGPSSDWVSPTSLLFRSITATIAALVSPKAPVAL